jgi:hypothetical protein
VELLEAVEPPKPDEPLPKPLAEPSVFEPLESLLGEPLEPVPAEPTVPPLQPLDAEPEPNEEPDPELFIALFN